MSAIGESRAVCIVRATTPDAALELGRRLIDVGVRVLEVSFTTPGAGSVIAELTSLARDTDAIVGAGTVIDAAVAYQAVSVGARFLISPNVSPEAIEIGNRHGVPVISGAQTATEALHAMQHGASAVKLFPASTVGVKGLAAIVEALPHIPFIPTGGVQLDSAEKWLDAGAVAVGLGTSIAHLDDDQLRSGLGDLLR